MISNATTRAATDQQAADLNQVYLDIVASGVTYNNFDFVYQPFPDVPIMTQWIANGGQAWQLIEPVDGFHPNQIFHSLLADYFWNYLTTNKSEWIGPENPNNALIQQLFGDQGGY
jgi:acyloxyacyl hydrolase